METLKLESHDSAVPQGGLQFGIDITALLIGGLAVMTIFRIMRQPGGRVNQALRFFTVGIVFNMLAIVWSLSSGHPFQIFGFYLDMHQNLMSVGLVFFIISALRFAKITSNV